MFPSSLQKGPQKKRQKSNRVLEQSSTSQAMQLPPSAAASLPSGKEERASHRRLKEGVSEISGEANRSRSTTLATQEHAEENCLEGPKLQQQIEVDAAEEKQTRSPMLVLHLPYDLLDLPSTAATPTSLSAPR